MVYTWSEQLHSTHIWTYRRQWCCIMSAGRSRVFTTYAHLVFIVCSSLSTYWALISDVTVGCAGLPPLKSRLFSAKLHTMKTGSWQPQRLDKRSGLTVHHWAFKGQVKSHKEALSCIKAQYNTDPIQSRPPAGLQNAVFLQPTSYSAPSRCPWLSLRTWISSRPKLTSPISSFWLPASLQNNFHVICSLLCFWWTTHS